MSHHRHLTRWVVWIIPVIFCAFQFVLRLFPGHVQTDLIDQFNISAAAFGSFSASYYLGYAGFQIPVAILLQKYKPSIVIATSAFLCGLGCLLLSLTDNWGVAIFSRFLVGVGSVAGLLGSTQVVLEWFPSRHHAKMIGVSLSLALSGALYGGKPIGLLLERFQWREVLLMMGLAVFTIGFFALILMKDKKRQNAPQQPVETVSWTSGIFSLIQNKRFLLLATVTFMMVGCLEGFADVWGLHYLSISASLPPTEAAFHTSLIYVGMILGMPALSMFADKTKAYVKITALCGFMLACLMIILFFLPDISSHFLLKIIMISMGFFSGYQVLIFVIGEQLVPKNLSNIAIASLNCSNMLGGAFFHKSIGMMLDLSTQGLGHSGHAYGLDEYMIGLSIIPVMSMMGAFLMLFYRKEKALR